MYENWKIQTGKFLTAQTISLFWLGIGAICYGLVFDTLYWVWKGIDPFYDLWLFAPGFDFSFCGYLARSI